MTQTASSTTALLRAGALAAGLAISIGTAFATDLRIGVIAPEDGNFALLGDQVRLALEAYGDSAEGDTVEIVPAPETCEDDNGADAATSMVEAGVDAVVGLFCMETLASAMPVLAESSIPAITISVRAGIIMEDAMNRQWPLFRLAPRADAEAERIAAIIAERWAGVPFALIEDGTIYGRDLVETIRLKLEEAGIQPSFVDNFRPAQELQFGAIRRLAASGVTHVFVGGDRADVAVMARNAAEIDMNLTFMGGDAMAAADVDGTLPDGILAVVARTRVDEARATTATRAIDARLEAEGPADALATDGYYLPSFAAAEILMAAKAESVEGDKPLDAVLRDAAFETALGTVSFGADQEQGGDDQYVLTVSRRGMLVPLDETAPLDAAGQ